MRELLAVVLPPHGYLKLIETWGSDENIIASARMSTDGAFRGWGDGAKPGDEKLLKYLWDNRHSSPFEMAGAVVEVQAPIFVFREWHRHRTQSYNELSARYTPLPDINYIPSIERLMGSADGVGKQSGSAAGSENLIRNAAQLFTEMVAAHYKTTQTLYEYSPSIGVSKELARLIIPVGRFSRMRASANLRNWLGFLELRNSPKAQWEIRQYAIALQSMLKTVFPRTLELFERGES